MIEYHFEKQNHKMQETWNNCFGQKKVARPFVRREQVITSARIWQQRIRISILVLTCFRMTMGRATFFWHETIVASFLHLMVLFFKVMFNHASKRQFVVLHFHIIVITVQVSWLDILLDEFSIACICITLSARNISLNMKSFFCNSRCGNLN